MDPQTNYSDTVFSSTPASRFSPPVMQRPKIKINRKIITIIISAILIIFGISYFYGQITKPITLSVSGVGKVTTVPQSVSLIVTRTNVALDPALAIDAGEAGLISLINEAKTIVGQDAEIQKSFYTTSVNSTQQTVSGQTNLVKIYQIANGFKITFKDVTKTDELIKTLYAKGASSISSVSFMAADKDKVEQEARKLAIENAKQEAEKIAKSMGKRVGRMLSFADDQADSSSTISSSQGSFGTESIDITKVISVIYEIR